MKYKMFFAVCVTAICTATFSACGESSFQPMDGSVIKTGYELRHDAPVSKSFETIVRNSDGTTIMGERQSNDHADCVVPFDSEHELMTAVGQRFDVIGFVSMRTPLSENVQRVSVSDVAPTAENIKSGTYALARPLFMIYQSYDSLSPLGKNFLQFIGSEEAQEMILSEGFAAAGEAQEYAPYHGTERKISVSASAFSYELTEKIATRYEELNAGVRVEIEKTQSAEKDMTDGNADFAAVDGNYTGATEFSATKYAEDGICIIVKKDSVCNNVTFEQLYRLYMEGLPIETVS